MKKTTAYPVLLIAAFCFFISANISLSQDFNLFNPTSELYLFSAYDEGSNAFRYNPAILGLSHKLNFTLNFLNHRAGFNGLNELDVSLNAGFLGLAFRRYTDNKDFFQKL